jgi:hypothetical protein
MPSPKSVKFLFGILSLLAALGILVCTLWPFDPIPQNEVSWLRSSQGMRFGKSGVVLSRERLTSDGKPTDSDSCGVEIWIQPAETQSVSTVLDFYKPDNPFQFLVRQYRDGLIVSRDFRDPNGKIRRSKIDLDHGLVAGKLILVTLSSSEKGTLLYLDGELREAYPKFRLTAAELTGQIILGTSPVNSQNWTGEIHGLALYTNSPTAVAAQEHLEEWQKSGGITAVSGDFKPIASYSFLEGRGETVHSQQNGGPDLFIPAHFFVPHQAFLTAPWNEFNPGWDYWQDLLRNVIGLMPLGIFLCVYLRFSYTPRNSILISLFGGFMLSLCVEIVQSCLPQRVSSMTDVLSNTLGTALGAYIGASPKMQQFLARIAL